MLLPLLIGASQINVLAIDSVPFYEYLTPNTFLECRFLDSPDKDLENIKIKIREENFVVLTDISIGLEDEYCTLQHHQKYINVIHCQHAQLPGDDVYYLINMPKGKVYNTKIGHLGELQCYRVKPF